MTKKNLLKYILKSALAIIMVILIIRVMIYPERAKIKKYRKELTIRHATTKAYVNGITHRDNTIYYEFNVNNVKYFGISRYSLLDTPYPEEGDSIEVYYNEEDPNVNLWRGEFPE